MRSTTPRNLYCVFGWSFKAEMSSNRITPLPEARTQPFSRKNGILTRKNVAATHQLRSPQWRLEIRSRSKLYSEDSPDSRWIRPLPRKLHSNTAESIARRENLNCRWDVRSALKFSNGMILGRIILNPSRVSCQESWPNSQFCLNTLVLHDKANLPWIWG